MRCGAVAGEIVRAIQLYHVKGNGWNDIGYNFLVDRFGTVFEGRYGGIERNVVGAHAEGFNTGTVGVAVLGEYSSLAVAAQARSRSRSCSPGGSTSRMWTRRPRSRSSRAETRASGRGCSCAFPVSGHRDTGFTDRPGTCALQPAHGIAGEVARTGLPKLYAPLVTGTVLGLSASGRGCRRRRRGRSTSTTRSEMPWSELGGSGLNVDWTWDATLLLPGSYSYSIRSDASVTPAFGPIGGSIAAFGVAGLAADPETVSPNADDIADLTTITYTLTEAGNATLKLRDGAGTGWRRSLPRASERASTRCGSTRPCCPTASSRSTSRRPRRVAELRLRRPGSPSLDARWRPLSPHRLLAQCGRSRRPARHQLLAAPAQIRLRILKEWASGSRPHSLGRLRDRHPDARVG